jgi:EAL domain-containing protein (putative c-di-GMP-specific phosphodiesterase class I)/AmiR/NasT family two-component response regulator
LPPTTPSSGPVLLPRPSKLDPPLVADEEMQNCRLLIVDDEPANVSLLEIVLADAGFANVEAIMDASLVLDRCRTDPPDLILLDLHMPMLDGNAILAELAALVDPGDFLPVVVVTADTTSGARDRALMLGATDFITKPFDIRDVSLRVRNLLGTRLANSRLRRDKALLDEQVSALFDHQSGEAERRRAITERVSRVAQGEGLAMVFQPVVELDTGRIVGAEALARFTGPPVQPPDVWFAEAAEVGFGLQLELAAIRAAVAQADFLPRGSFMSVNASPNTICSQHLSSELSRHPDVAIVLEVTEQQYPFDEARLSESADRLCREHGVRVAIDDTGAGYASLSRILGLRPQVIKLDRFLILGIDEDPVRQTLTSALVRLADQLGAMLIAEGLESVEELATVRDLGVLHGQGFLLQRPGSLPFDANTIVI